MYNFVKLSDAPVVEDGATHVLGTKEGQVFRIPASGLGRVVLGLDQPEVVPTSVNAVAPRDISPGSTDGAVLTLPTGETYVAKGDTFVSPDLYAKVEGYIRQNATLMIRESIGGQLRRLSPVVRTEIDTLDGVSVINTSYFSGPRLVCLYFAEQILEI